MKSEIVSLATASFILAFATCASAQSNTTDDSARQTDRSGSFTHGESKHCESLSGEAKEQCDRDEATKTDGSASTGDREKQGAAESPASSGSTSDPGSGAGAPPPGMSAD
jgi:hypothetical protein